MKKLTKEQTEKFVWIWNERNGFPQGLTEQPNMRYVSKGIVSWNEYDAPDLDLNEVADIIKAIGEI